jgi:hypothetical protein
MQDRPRKILSVLALIIFLSVIYLVGYIQALLTNFLLIKNLADLPIG